MDIFSMNSIPTKRLGRARIDRDIRPSESSEEGEGVSGRVGERGVAVNGTDS